MTTIYRGYDQTGLDAQYNLRARFPDYQDWFEAWARDSAAVRHRLPCRLDLAYGPTPMERLDWFPAIGLPPGGRAPVLVFIHGGYWQFLDKSDMSFLAPPFVAAGVAFAALNYALAPAVSVDEIVRQVRNAIAWLWREAPGLGGDPDRIHVAGHSAGGHLTAMAMATDWPCFGGLPPEPVKGAYAVSGIYDLEPIRLSYQNPVLKLDRAAVKRNSPLLLPPPRTGRLMLSVGELEPPEFHRQQDALAAAWTEQGQAIETIAAPGLHHFDILAKFAVPEHPIGQAALRLVTGE